MPSENQYEMDSNDLYNRIAGMTGDDFETIASLGFEVYATSHFDERKWRQRKRRQDALRERRRRIAATSSPE